MTKPNETRTLARIAGILIAAGMGCKCLLTLFRAPLRLLNHGNPVNISVSGTVLLLMLIALRIPLMLLAFRSAKQEKLTLESTRTEGLLTLVFGYGLSLFSLVVQLGGRHFLDMGDYAGIAMISNFTRIFDLCYSAGLSLLVCAAAVDLYAVSRRDPGITRRLTLAAMICAGACLVLKCMAVLFPAKSLFDVSGALTLPMKWKCILLVQVLAELVPIGILAIWCWCSP